MMHGTMNVKINFYHNIFEAGTYILSECKIKNVIITFILLAIRKNTVYKLM